MLRVKYSLVFMLFISCPANLSQAISFRSLYERGWVAREKVSDSVNFQVSSRRQSFTDLMQRIMFQVCSEARTTIGSTLSRRKPSWIQSRRSCLQTKFVRYIILCVLPILNFGCQIQINSPSGLRAEALAIFFWQMVISN